MLNMSIYSTHVNNLYYSLVFSLSLKISNSKIPCCASVLDKTCALPLMGSFFFPEQCFLLPWKQTGQVETRIHENKCHIASEKHSKVFRYRDAYHLTRKKTHVFYWPWDQWDQMFKILQFLNESAHFMFQGLRLPSVFSISFLLCYHNDQTQCLVFNVSCLVH